MKEAIIIFTLLILNACSPKSSNIKSTNTSKMTEMNFYDMSINSVLGDKTIKLSDYKGKKILCVNVASECGFTPQYKELQQLADEYKDKLVVIGFPCNQFGGQEPGSGTEIKAFCEKNYGVTFLITEKIDVKGENQHPIYQWLTHKSANKLEDYSVKWNFGKFLISENGQLLDYFSSMTKPMSEEIVTHLK
jgi:glutathione peroxidase